MKIAPVLFWVAISIWVGGITVLGLIVAPTVFRNAPSREVAGSLFGASLRNFAYVEFACAIIAACAMGLRLAKVRGNVEWFRTGLLGLMIVLLLIVHAWLAPAMRDLQPRMGPDGPERARFSSLHRISEKLYGANMLLGLVLIAVSAWPRDPA